MNSVKSDSWYKCLLHNIKVSHWQNMTAVSEFQRSIEPQQLYVCLLNTRTVLLGKDRCYRYHAWQQMASMSHLEFTLYKPTHEIMALIALCKLNLQQSTGATCLIFGQTLRLLPCFMCANSEGSGEAAQMRSLIWAFAVRLCDKYDNLMSWLIYLLSVLLSVEYSYFLDWLTWVQCP